MQNPTIDVNAPVVRSGTITAGDVMRLLNESASGAGLETYDFSVLSYLERQRLAELFEQRGLPLSPEDKARFERGDREELKALLRRAEAHFARERQGLEAQAARASDALGETPAKSPDVGSPPPGIPENTRPRIALAEGEREAVAPPPVVTEAEEEIWPTDPCFDAATLESARRDLLAMITVTSGKTKITSEVDDRRQALKTVLGEVVAKPILINDFPADGYSGSAARLPLLQLAPESLRATLEGLGIYTLADLLTRGLLPAGRLLIAEMLGVPADLLLVVLCRAELLDLPILTARGKPHIKDLLLLSRLGITTVAELARLAALFDARPELLELFAKLIAKVQRADGDYVGRQSITRHELTEWTRAAAKRGSHLVCPHDQAAKAYSADVTEREDARQVVMAWHLAHRYPKDDDLLDTLLYNAVSWLRERCADTEELTREALAAGTEELRLALRDTEAERLEAAHLEAARAQALWQKTRHAIDDEELAAREQSWSLWRKVAPRLLCEGKRDVNKRVGFWLLPGPLSAGLRPYGARPRYVCINPESGAIEPV